MDFIDCIENDGGLYSLLMCSFFVLGGIVMCSKLGVWGYGQIAQNCEEGKMFVYIVHADN